jgi:KDO2-lipid IV(A) lauroyltransferase
MREDRAKVKHRKRERRLRGPGLREHLEVAGLRLLASMLRLMPLEAASALTGTLFRLFGRFSDRNRRAAANIALALPELDAGARRGILSEQWDNLGRTAAESLLVDRIVATPWRLDLVLSPELERRLAEAGGLVVVSMHSANWEIPTLAIQRFRPVMGLYQRLTNPLVEPYVLKLRENIFNGGLLPKGREAAHEAMKWVREGNAVAMLVDQREGRGLDVTTFGQKTRANPFPAMVARRLAAPLIAGRCVRLPGCRFRLEAVEIPVTVTDDMQADVAAATQAVQDRFEIWIRERPGEWMWVQNRWPGGARAIRRHRDRPGELATEEAKGQFPPDVEGQDR